MQRAHHKLNLDNTHFDAVMEVLDRVFDIEVDGKRVVSWRMKVMAMREAEELRQEIISPDVKPKRVERKVADVLERRVEDHGEVHKLGVTEASVLNLSIGVLPEYSRNMDHLERYSDHGHHHDHHHHDDHTMRSRSPSSPPVHHVIPPKKKNRCVQS
jgi:hypothetical protein